MNNEIAKLDFQGMNSIAEMFFKSGMFPNVQSQAQALVKIAAGQEMGLPPFFSMSGIHIIKGKAAPGAGIIASMIKASKKYNFKVIEHTNEKCKLEFFEDGESAGFEEFTIEMARQAGTQNIDKFPKNMLFARCISNGQKFYAPDIFLGSVYDPSELIDDTPPVDYFQLFKDCPNLEEFKILKQQVPVEMWLNVEFKDYTIQRFLELGGTPKKKEEGEVIQIQETQNYGTTPVKIVQPETPATNDGNTLSELPL